MSSTSKSPRRLPWKGTTILVIAILALTIVPAFIAFALTPSDAQVVTSVQGYNGCGYWVRPGDNLFRIGVRYGVSYNYLAQMNGIYNPNYIWAGQTISVPCAPVPYGQNYPSYRPVYPPYQCPWCQPFAIPQSCAANTISYTVQPGDNLFRIAVYNGSTIQWIRTENDLWGKVLLPGMVLTIPCVNYVSYPNISTPTPGGPTQPPVITATPGPTRQPGNQIQMQNNQYIPRTRTVRVGTTVTWTNTDPGGLSYTVTSGVNGVADGNFSSGTIPPGGTFQFQFTTAGSYSYFSSTNPTVMTGEIIVNP
jgi:plastocyanin/LysM repeat protein